MSTINFPLTTTSLFVNTLNTNKIIYLPAASTVNAGRLFYIKDICGNAARSSIYISTTGMDRIENRFQPSTLYALMSTNYGSVLMAPDGALNWYFLQHFYKSAVLALPSGGQAVATNTFSPISIPGIQLWLDGNDPVATGTQPTNGSTVSTWVDKSGNGYNGTQVNSPTYDSSRKAIYFTGSTQYYTLPDSTFPTGNSSYTYFMIVNFASMGSSPNWVGVLGGGGYTNSTTIAFRTNGAGGGFYEYWYANDNYSATTYNTNTIVAIESVYVSGVSRVLIQDFNTFTTKTTDLTRNQGATNNAIGRAYSNAEYMNGHIHEVLVYNMALSTTQRQMVEGYLAHKWEIQASLPSGHPYKSVAPTGTTFTPASTTGMVLWLDGADSSTITTSTGVSQWNDKSGNAYNLTQGTAGSQPTRTGNYLNFQSNYYLNVPFSAMNNLSTWSIFLVINPISASNWIMVKQKDGANTYNVISMTYNTTSGGLAQTGTSGYLYWRSYNAGAQAASANALTTSAVQILNIMYNGTSLYMYINGTLNSTTSGAFAIQNDTSPSSYTLGSWIQGVTLNNSGVTSFQLGEFLSYSSNLTTTNRQRVEGYLAHKWGIQPSLPSTHPYKSVAPTNAIGTPIVTGLRYQFDAAKNLPTTSGWTDTNAYGNLTFYNTPTVTTGNVNYVSFNGTNQYGASVDMTNLTAFTITMWIRTTSTTNNSTFYLKPHLIGEGSGGNASRDFGLTIGGGYAGIWSGIGSTDTQNQSETNTSAANYIANGLWHELTVTSSYTNGSRLYVNGTQFGSSLPASQATESGQNWNIAATNYLAGGPNCWAAADISVVLLYTRELSSTEVTSNFNSYRSRFGR